MASTCLGLHLVNNQRLRLHKTTIKHSISTPDLIYIEHLATSSLGAGPLFEQSFISLRVKQWNEVDLNYFTEALLLCGLTVSTLVDIVPHFRNSPHFSIGLILTDVIQMLGKFKWSIHNKTSTWNSCKKEIIKIISLSSTFHVLFI